MKDKEKKLIINEINIKTNKEIKKEIDDDMVPFKRQKDHSNNENSSNED